MITASKGFQILSRNEHTSSDATNGNLLGSDEILNGAQAYTQNVAGFSL
jgi:hypothetical protein